MLYLNTQFTEMPPAVRLEPLPDGTTNIWLAKGITAVPGTGDDDNNQTAFSADIAFCTAGEGEQVTVTAIEADFDMWWERAAEWTRNPPKTGHTTEDRIAALEKQVAAAKILLGLD